MNSTHLKSSSIETPLGPMIALADERALYFLGFMDSKNLDRDINRLCRLAKATMMSGMTDPLISIQTELQRYFEGNLTVFQTPLFIIGSSFQKNAWEALIAIPYGESQSYVKQATSIGHHSAYRAVANANGVNRISIVIPCHRIINHNGKLGGYGGGLHRKKWLLDHEKTYSFNK